MKVFLAVAVGLILAGTAPALRSQEWARFLGADGRGHGDANDVPTKFTVADYRWQRKLGGLGHSSPVVWGSRLFLTLMTEERQRKVQCFETGNGQTVWEWEMGFVAHNKHRFNEFASATPCVDSERLYTTWTSGGSMEAVALDHQGALAWKNVLGPFEGDHGGGSSPILVDGILFLFWDHLSDGVTYYAGLDPASGEPVWQNGMRWPGERKTSYSTPAIHRNSKGKTEVIVSSMTFGVQSFDPKTGKVNWQYDHGFRARTVGSPVVSDGVVFAAWGSGNGAKDHVALIPGTETRSGKPEVAWRKTKPDGAPDNRGFPYVPTPLAVNGIFYMWADSGILQAVEARTGKVIFGPERVGGEFYSNPILVGTRIFCASRDRGEMVVVEAGRRFEVLARNPLDSGVNATPAVSGGRMFIRTNAHLICLGAP